MSGKRMTTWDDDTIKGGGYNERPDVYKAKQGYTDIIRFCTVPVSLLLVNVNPKGGKGFSTPTLADYDDVMDGFIDGNDKDAQARAKKACPALERGYGVKRRFVTLVWHAYRLNRKGQKKKVMQAIPMIFDGGKYEMIHAIKQSLPPMKNGKKRPLHLVEISVTCTDSQYQKMNFSMNPTPSQKWAEVKEEIEELFENGFDASEETEIVKSVTEADSYQSLRESLDRVEGRGNFDDDDDDSEEWDEETEDDADDEEEEERPRRRGKKKTTKKRSAKKKSRRKAKPEPEEDDEDDEDLADELDESLDDEDLDDYDEDEDD